MLFSFQFKIQRLSRIRITEIVLSVIGNTKVKGSKVIVVNNIHSPSYHSFFQETSESFFLALLHLTQHQRTFRQPKALEIGDT